MDIHGSVYSDSEDESVNNEEPLNLSINSNSHTTTSNSSSSISNYISTESSFGHSSISNNIPESSFCQLSKFVNCDNIDNTNAKIVINSNDGNRIINSNMTTNSPSFSSSHGISIPYIDLTLSPIPRPRPTAWPQPSIVSNGPRPMPRIQPSVILPNIARPMTAPLPNFIHRRPIPTAYHSSNIYLPSNIPRQQRPTVINPHINQFLWRQHNSMSSVIYPISCHSQPIPFSNTINTHQIQMSTHPTTSNCDRTRSPFGQVFSTSTNVFGESHSNSSTVPTLCRTSPQETIHRSTSQNPPYSRFQISPRSSPQLPSTSTDASQRNYITKASASLYSVENTEDRGCTLLYHTHLVSPGMVSCQVTPLSSHSESNSSLADIVQQILDMESCNANVQFKSPPQPSSQSSSQPLSQPPSPSPSQPQLQTPSSRISTSPTLLFSSPDDINVPSTPLSVPESSTSPRTTYTSKENTLKQNLKDSDVITIESDSNGDLQSSPEKEQVIHEKKLIEDEIEDASGVSKMEELTKKLPGKWDNMDRILKKTFKVPHTRWFLKGGIAHRVVGLNPTLLQKKLEKDPTYRAKRKKLTRKFTRQEQKFRLQKALLDMEVEKHNQEVENSCLRDTINELKIQKLCLLRTIFDHEKKCPHKCNINYNEYLQDYMSQDEQPHCSYSTHFDEGGVANDTEVKPNKFKKGGGEQMFKKSVEKRLYDTDDDSTSCSDSDD